MMETIFTLLPNTEIMFNSIQGFGDQLFSVIVLVIAAGISSHFCFGYGTKKAKETFIALILVLIVGTQLFHLINAATYVPASKFFVFDVRTTVNLLRFYIYTYHYHSCFQFITMPHRELSIAQIVF